jgi:hypothetical protein
MGMHLDEPVAAMAAAAFTLGGAMIGGWWQRRRAVKEQEKREDDARSLDARFDRLEAITEATALEVERIGEGQRFTTKLLVERGTPGVSPSRPASRPAEHNTPH